MFKEIILLLIISKKDVKYKSEIKYIISEYNIPYIDIKNIYNKYLGGLYFFNNKSYTNMVFNTKISYQEIENNKTYLKLKVNKNYLIPSISEGIVIFIGNKEKYGNTIILKVKNNINVWYGNIANSSLKLYDKVEKGEYIGEANGEILYISYTKGNKTLNAAEIFKNQ